MSTNQKRPFAPEYKTTAEYLFDLAKWYASQDRMPEASEVSSDFRYVHELEAFKNRVFALMIGSEVTIKPGYWVTDLDGTNPTKIDGNYSEALAHAIAVSKSNPGSVYKFIRQYVHALKTISERVGLIYEGEFYRR